MRSLRFLSSCCAALGLLLPSAAHAVDSKHYVYVADQGNGGQVLRIATLQPKLVDTIATDLGTISGLAVDTLGHVLVARNGTTLTVVSKTTQPFDIVAKGSVAGISTYAGVVYVASPDNNSVYTFREDGPGNWVPGQGYSKGLDHPTAVLRDADRLYVVVGNPKSVQSVDALSGQLGTQIPSINASAEFLAVNPGTRLFVSRPGAFTSARLDFFNLPLSASVYAADGYNGLMESAKGLLWNGANPAGGSVFVSYTNKLVEIFPGLQNAPNTISDALKPGQLATGPCYGESEEIACDDGDPCTENTVCQDGECVGGDKVSCDSSTICQRTTCDPLLGCAQKEDADCASDTFCIEGAHCSKGTCVGPDNDQVPQDCTDPPSPEPCKTSVCRKTDYTCVPDVVAAGTFCGEATKCRPM